METLSYLQVKLLISGLKFEQKTGMKMTRHVNSKKIAREFLGLSTRANYHQLIDGLERVIEIADQTAKKDEVTIINL